MHAKSSSSVQAAIRLPSCSTHPTASAPCLPPPPTHTPHSPRLEMMPITAVTMGWFWTYMAVASDTVLPDTTTPAVPGPEALNVPLPPSARRPICREQRAAARGRGSQRAVGRISEGQRQQLRRACQQPRGVKVPHPPGPHPTHLLQTHPPTISSLLEVTLVEESARVRVPAPPSASTPMRRALLPSTRQPSASEIEAAAVAPTAPVAASIRLLSRTSAVAAAAGSGKGGEFGCWGGVEAPKEVSCRRGRGGGARRTLRCPPRPPSPPDLLQEWLTHPHLHLHQTHRC